MRKSLLLALLFVAGCTCSPGACTFDTAETCAHACDHLGGKMTTFGVPGRTEDGGPICRCEYPAVRP